MGNTPLQQLAIDLVDILVADHELATEILLDNLTSNHVAAMIFDVFEQSELSVAMMQVEICNHPMQEGSSAHHNQPDTCYRSELFPVIDGHPMSLDYPKDEEMQLRVLENQLAAEKELRLIFGPPRTPDELVYLRTTQPDSGFYLPPSHALVQRVFQPLLAKYNAARIEESTPQTSSRPTARL